MATKHDTPFAPKPIIWDKFNMILQTSDGGDSAANIGTYHIFCETRRRMGHQVFSEGLFEHREKADFETALNWLESPSVRGLGLYRRHPDEFFWGSRTNTMSRDQTVPLLGAMALYGMRRRVAQYMVGHAMRAFLFTTNTTPNWAYKTYNPNNLTWIERIKFFFGWQPGRVVYATKLPDLTLFEFWALELRGLYHWAFWPIFFPVLCVLDIHTWFGSWHKVNVYGRDPRNSDDRNHVNTLIVGLQVCPTPIMKFAAKLYRNRPWAFDQTTGTMSDMTGPQSALNHYYRAKNSPPFNVLGAPI